MDETMDRYYGYRNLLAAEEHISELLMGPESPEEGTFLRGVLNEIRYLRDDFIPGEKNKRYHCLVKHLSAAYEAASEVAKATQRDLDDIRAKALRSLLYSAIEKLLDRKIIICERCGVKEENGRLQEEGNGVSTEANSDGLTRIGIQGAGDSGVIGVFSSETGYSVGDEVDRTKSSLTGREGEAPF